ncbi:MAG: hypothetical protein ACYDCL_15175 [Myxococcales bacterium]
MSAARPSTHAWALWAYLGTSVACAALAGGATWRIHTLETSAHWIEGQLHDQAQAYANTLQGRYADDEMESFRERRSLLTSSATWFQIRIGCLMLWVLATFAFYIHRAISSLSEELTEPIR